MTDKHTHDFKQWEMETITIVQEHYKGSAGDKAFLVRKCTTCPAKVYTEYGGKSEMEQKLWELVAKL